jgi:hypothetical protein
MSAYLGRWTGGLAGILSPILWLAGFLSAPDIFPPTTASTEQVISFFRQHSGEYRLQAFLFGLSFVTLLWFLGARGAL